MTRKKSRKRVRQDVVAAWVDLYESLFVSIMQGILKATTVEEEYASLASEVRQKTQDEIHKIGRLAAERFVELANPDPTNATKEEIDRWKVQAIESALRSSK